MFQPRPWDTSEAVCLSVVELLNVFKDPFLELHFKLADLLTISDGFDPLYLVLEGIK